MGTPATWPTAIKNAEDTTLADLTARVLVADRDLEALAKYLAQTGHEAEALAARDIQDVLAGRCPRCRHLHPKSAPCCPCFSRRPAR